MSSLAKGKFEGSKPPSASIQLEKVVRWKDVKDLVFQAIQYGSPSDFEAKRLAQMSLSLLGERQARSPSLNLSFYSTVCNSLEFLTDDEIRRLALQCITRCTDKEENCDNIVSIAQKVGAINTRYFDYKYRGKPYLPKKVLSVVDQEVAVANVVGSASENLVDDSESGVFDISKSLGYIPYMD